jgi:hypothetical protein
MSRFHFEMELFSEIIEFGPLAKKLLSTIVHCERPSASHADESVGGLLRQNCTGAN